MKTGQVSVTDVATSVVPEHGSSTGATIHNVDADNTVYVGAAGVTHLTGYGVGPGEAVGVDLMGEEVFGICSSGLSAEVHWLVTGV